MGHNRYSCVVQGTSATANGDDTFIQIQAASGTRLKITRVRASADWGTIGGSFDAGYRVKLCRLSAVGSGTTSTGTVTEIDANSQSTTSTVTVKNANNFFTTGSIIDTVILNQFFWQNGFDWFAVDASDAIMTDVGGIFAVVLSDPAPASNLTAYCNWQEI